MIKFIMNDRIQIIGILSALAASMEDKLSTTIVSPPIFRVPTEIRLKIYRLLLLSDQTIRMQWYEDDDSSEDYIRHLNGLFPAILSTCHLIHNEAIDVLYRENIFRAHRINDDNKNAALIARAKFIIGTEAEDALIRALGLAKFLETHPNLKLLKLEFRRNLLEDSYIRDTLRFAILTTGYSSALAVSSEIKSERCSYNEARILEAVNYGVFLRKYHFSFPKEGGLKPGVPIDKLIATLLTEAILGREMVPNQEGTVEAGELSQEKLVADKSGE